MAKKTLLESSTSNGFLQSPPNLCDKIKSLKLETRRELRKSNFLSVVDKKIVWNQRKMLNAVCLF